jgi:proline dehydrogenase
VSARTRPLVRRLPAAPLFGRVLAGPGLAGPGIDDALRVAGELVAGGHQLALEHLPAAGDDAAAEFAALLGRVHAAGLAARCELTLPVERLGAAATRALAAAAREAGVAVVLAGPPAVVDEMSGGAADVGVVVPAGEPDAEFRCRARARGRVRLTEGRGAAADLAFVRCVNVLMADDGRPAIAATDPRLIAIAGERAAWNGRAPDSWEHVMPYGVRTDEQQRLVAAGYTVRVAVTSGRGAVPSARGAVRRLVGRP